MKLSDATQKSKGIDDKILELIDLKTEDDMRQVITQLQASEKILGEKLQSTEKYLQSLEKRFDMILWILGIALAMMIAISAAVMALK